jgi:hypothetical protein
MRRTTMFLATALTFAPVALWAQDSTSSAAGPDARVHAALETALDAGIPVDLLQRKIAEGKAKGVSMDRIAAAVEKRLDALTKASDAMTKAGVDHPTEGDLSVAADAVQGGVSATALTTISQSAPQDRRAVAIAVLTELVAQGTAPESALERVQTALARGPEALANLHGATAGSGESHAAAGGSAVGGTVGVGAGTRVEVGPPRSR